MHTRLLFLITSTLAFFAGCGGLPPAPTKMGRVVNPAEVAYERFRPDSARRPETYAFRRTRSYEATNYLPDTNNLALLPERTILLNFHIMNSTDTVHDFHGEAARAWLWQLVHYMNEKLADNPESWLTPDSTTVPALPTRIRLETAKDPDRKGLAIYEHYDDKLYAYLHNGPKRNRADRAVVNKYNIREDSELNIYLMGPPKDSLSSPTFRSGGNNGIYLGNAIKVGVDWSGKSEPWMLRGIVAHEIGHALGLGHAWTSNDGCDDTPPNANNGWTAKRRGPGLTSNNLMDYSPQQEALTPCQISRIHARLASPNSQQRGWAKRDWCTYRMDAPVVVATSSTLEGQRDFAGDLIVKSGATLTINARVHLPEGAALYVEPGAELILGPKAVVHNDCGGTWGGIQVGHLPDGYAGRVRVDAAATLLNVGP